MKTLGLSEIESRGADIMVARLRKKLERDSKNPERLLTVRGEGYVWKT
jgi:DNA-binding response OmpR family regulator